LEKACARVTRESICAASVETSDTQETAAISTHWPLCLVSRMTLAREPGWSCLGWNFTSPTVTLTLERAHFHVDRAMLAAPLIRSKA
jgi:hypothetical protein